jgi:hypothetical protein
MAINSIYITDTQIATVLTKLGITLGDAEVLDVYTRAAADLEGDLSYKYVVPLTVLNSAYTAAPAFAINKVAQAMIYKIREVLAADNNRNTGVLLDNGQKYLDLNRIAYKNQIKDLLDPKLSFGFQLNANAVGSAEPVQSLGLARANNRFEIVRDPTL